MKGYLTVSEAAKFLEVSERRVRYLLAQGRIDGFKDERDIWHINLPLDIKPGKRGPELRGFATRQLPPKRYYNDVD